jgi:hypothetical protein
VIVQRLYKVAITYAMRSACWKRKKEHYLIHVYSNVPPKSMPDIKYLLISILMLAQNRTFRWVEGLMVGSTGESFSTYLVGIES